MAPRHGTIRPGSAPESMLICTAEVSATRLRLVWSFPEAGSLTIVEERPPAIEMTGITKRFAGVVANEDVRFTARYGEVHALIGENGAGKSTLMSILAGLYRPDEGEIVIEGQAAQLRSPRDAIQRGIGMVYQHFMLVEPFTVAENVLLGRDGTGSWLRTRDVEGELRALGARYGLDVDPAALVWQLSVGEQQRVEILRLLHRGARILVFDEPTAVLTPQESDALLATMRGMAAEGLCVIFISHKLNEVLSVSDRITVLRRGKVVDTVESRDCDRHKLAEMMVGRRLASLVEHPEDEGLSHEQPRDPLLQIEGLVVDGDKGRRAVAGIDLTVRGGEVLGIAGVAGNGQRELAEAITGLRRASAGRVRVDGRDVTNESPGMIAGAGVAHIPEDRLATGLAGGMDVADNAALRDYRSAPLSRGPFLVTRAIAAFTDRLIGEYQIKTPSRKTRVRSLSGGNQQKLLIARELEGEPKVVVAVHPTRGVDIGATETIHGLLDQQRHRGAAVLLISEDLDELTALSDRVAVLYAGRVAGVMPAREATADRVGPLMAGLTVETQGGNDA